MAVLNSLLSLSAIIIVRILQPADTPTLLIMHGKGENTHRHVHHGRYRTSPDKEYVTRESSLYFTLNYTVCLVYINSFLAMWAFSLFVCIAGGFTEVQAERTAIAP